MTRPEMKRRLRMGGKFRPEDELSLDVAIDESVQHTWNAYDWSFRKSVDNFTSDGSATKELPYDVDVITEMTYGDNNQVVSPLPSERVAEIYSNVARTGSTVYYYSLHSVNSDNVTLEFTPTPSSGDVFTYRFRKKIDYGDLASIPEKLHGLVMVGARSFLATGIVSGNPSYESGLASAILGDQPIKERKWRMGMDGLIAARVNARNALVFGGTMQDTTHPHD